MNFQTSRFYGIFYNSTRISNIHHVGNLLLNSCCLTEGICIFPISCLVRKIWRGNECQNAVEVSISLIVIQSSFMMTSSNGDIFRVTGHLCGEITGPRWISRTKASDAELDVFFDVPLNKRLSKQSSGWWFETPSRPLWRHHNVI